MDLHHIMPVATFVREKLTELRVTEPSLTWIRENLGGACALGSYALHILLKEKGIESQMVVGYYWDGSMLEEHGLSLDQLEDMWKNGTHCWLELNGMVLDITATQFGLIEPVLYVPASDSRFESRWKGEEAMEVLTKRWRNGWLTDKVFGELQVAVVLDAVKTSWVERVKERLGIARLLGSEDVRLRVSDS